MNFFDRAYKFILQEIGYRGTDKNVISAVIHFDETTPHLQLYYLPIVDKGKKKVYALGTDGKVLRNAKGSPVQEKKNGKSVYKYVDLKRPKICSSDFWEERGGLLSFGNLQDSFYDCVSIRYGLNAAKSEVIKNIPQSMNGKSNNRKPSLHNLKNEQAFVNGKRTSLPVCEIRL